MLTSAPCAPINSPEAIRGCMYNMQASEQKKFTEISFSVYNTCNVQLSSLFHLTFSTALLSPTPPQSLLLLLFL